MINKLKLIAVMQIGLLISNFSEEEINVNQVVVLESDIKKDSTHQAALSFIEEYKKISDNFIQKIEEQSKSKIDSLKALFRKNADETTYIDFEELFKNPKYKNIKDITIADCLKEKKIAVNELLSVISAFPEYEYLRKNIMESLFFSHTLDTLCFSESPEYVFLEEETVA